MPPNPHWRPVRPESAAWKPPPDMSPSERAREQDRAAGGNQAREITLPDGRVVHGSIELKLPEKSRRIYAYLRFTVDGKTYNRYVGEVNAGSRDDNLAQAWATVLRRQLTRWNVDDD